MSAEWVGKVLAGQFRIDSLLSRTETGSIFSAAYIGVDLKRNIPVVLKILPFNQDTNPVWVNSFEQQINKIKSLDRVDLLSYFGLYQTNRFSFLVRNFVEGLSLQNYLEENLFKPIPPGKILSLVRLLSSTLGYAHEHGVIHANLKPSNIIITPVGSISLVDFNLNLQIKNGTDLHLPVKAPVYLAPEQFINQPVTPATDIYALGVILYELITFQKPFRGSHPASAQAGEATWERIRYEHLRQVPPDPVAYNRDLSPQVADVILKTLEKNPSLRYLEILHLFEDLCQAYAVFPESVPDRIVFEGMPIFNDAVPLISDSSGLIHAIQPPTNLPPDEKTLPVSKKELWERPIKRKTIIARPPKRKNQIPRWLIGFLIFALLIGVFGIITIVLLILNY